MLTNKEIIRKIEHHKETIRSFGVTRLTLIGSYAQGKQTKNSDIDFLVEFKKGRGLFDDYVHLLQYIRDIFQKEVDLVKPALLREELRSSILEGAKLEARI